MKLVVINKDGCERLNSFVTSSSLAHFKQLYEWGQVLEYEGTRAIRLGVERNGQLCASLALYVRRLPGLNVAFLSGARGPILDFRDREALACLLEGVKGVAHEHKALFLRVDPECGDDDYEVREALCNAGFLHLREKRWSDLSDPRVVMHLDLTPSEPELFKGMRETHRRHVRWIGKKGLSLRSARDASDVVRFREIMREVGERRGFPVRSLAYYDKLWTHFIQPGQGELLLAEREGSPVAGLLAIVTGKKAWLLYTGLLTAARELHPNEAVWWEALRWAKRQGAVLFNFGGSGTDWPPQPDSPGYTVYSFKRGFKAEAVYYTGYYDFVFKPKLYQLFRLTEEWLLPRVAGAFQLLERLSKAKDSIVAFRNR